MIVGGENLPICILDALTYENARSLKPNWEVQDDKGASYLFVVGLPCIFRKQVVH